jgi:hypothetical protein
MMFFTSSISLIIVEEVVEEMFFVLWCSLQYVRIIMFIKHQKEAKTSSKLIDYKHFHSDSIQNKNDGVFIGIDFAEEQKTIRGEAKNRSKSGFMV